MTVRQHEAVAIGPVGILRIMSKIVTPQHFGDIGRVTDRFELDEEQIRESVERATEYLRSPEFRNQWKWVERWDEDELEEKLEEMEEKLQEMEKELERLEKKKDKIKEKL